MKGHERKPAQLANAAILLSVATRRRSADEVLRDLEKAGIITNDEFHSAIKFNQTH